MRTRPGALRTPLILLSASLLLPAAHAETTTFNLATVSISVTTNDVPDCVASVPLPCPLGYDTNGTPLPTDDTAYLNRSIDSVAIVAPGAPSLAVDLAETRINHTAYAQLQDGILAAHRALPAPLRDLIVVYPTSGDTSVGVSAPSLHGTEVSNNTDYLNIGVPGTNRTGSSIPGTLLIGDTDDWVPGALDYARLCDVPQLGNQDAVTCDALPVPIIQAAWPALTPRVITGAHVGNASMSPTPAPLVLLTTPGTTAGIGAGNPAEAAPLRRVDDAPLMTRPPAAEPFVHAPPSLPVLSDQGARAPASAAASERSVASAGAPWVGAVLLSLVLPLAWLYHRITGRNALRHKHRARIHELLGEQPGVDVSTLSRELGLNFKSTAHHVSVLRRGGFVQVRRKDRRVLVFRTGEEKLALRAAALRHPARQRVVDELRSSPGLRQADLARRLATTRSVVHAHVRVLVESGVVVRHGPRLYLTDAPLPRLPAHLADLAAAATLAA